MRVRVPGPLRSYTGGQAEVEAEGATAGGLLEDLDRRYPGIRFRMVHEQGGFRQHIRLFVNRELVLSLAHPLSATDEVQILCSISGG